jgi:multicomponent Na+:H+ antiporter subunit A
MLIAVLSGFIVAVAAPWIVRLGKMRGWLLALLPLALTIYFASLTPVITAGEAVTASYPWVPSMGLNLSFRLDGLSWLFALLVCGIGIVIFIYAGTYMDGDPLIGRFYAYILVFMASMLGLVLAENVIALFVFWELTSFSSYLLIGFKHQYEDARKAALRALLVTSGGGLALLAGLILMGIAGNNFEISSLVASNAMTGHPLYTPVLLLILLGAFTKSAQMPFHFWLPGAMTAPSPVSAYLHSATMVKAGIYLLARLSPVLAGTNLWHLILPTVGGLTMLIGAFLSLRQVDLKRILAYSTISSLGTLVFLLGLDNPLAVQAAVVFLLVHSLYKGALFLIAGIIEHETGTRNITDLGGLRLKMPIVALAAGLAVLSMAGIPPLFGFVSKELLYEVTLEAHQSALAFTIIAVIANTFLVAVAALVFLRPFMGVPVDTPKQPHHEVPGLWLGPLLLGAGGLVAGLTISQVGQTFIAPAASVVASQPVPVKLALWHGINPMLILSAITVMAGLVLYRYRHLYERVSSRLDPGMRWSPAQWYEYGLNDVLALARFQTRLLQHGYLRIYLLVISLVIVGFVGPLLVLRQDFTTLVFASEIQFHEVIIVGIIAVAIIFVLFARSRLAAVVALGVVGYGIAFIFLLYGAPDLAMTQFAIETLTVILMVLILYRLPPFVNFSSRRQRLRDAVIALAVGALMTTLVLIASASIPQSLLTPFFTENSYSEAHGRNIVNVILVDFRGIDTLGEITVLAIAASGVLALLRFRPSSQEVDLTSTVETESVEIHENSRQLQDT